jgi:hypothetical protein
MKIIDNFLSEEDFKNLETTITKGDFQWRKSVILSGGRFKPNKIFNIQFVHRFANIHTESVDGVLEKVELVKSPHFDIIEPILDKIDYSSIIRIKANLNVAMLKPEPSGFHIDAGDGNNVRPGYTGIYYVNTCNGYTLFRDGTKVDSVANRMLIFDNQLQHTGVPCNDNRHRIVINFNWLP